MVRPARIHLEQHHAAQPQRAAAARSDRRWHEDRPYRHRRLLPRHLRQARRHAPDLRGDGLPSIKAREDASAALLNYGYTFFETGKVKARGELIVKPHVYKGAKRRGRRRFARGSMGHGRTRPACEPAHQRHASKSRWSRRLPPARASASSRSPPPTATSWSLAAGGARRRSRRRTVDAHDRRCRALVQLASGRAPQPTWPSRYRSVT